MTLPGRAPRPLEAHRRVLAAIESQDEDAAAEAMREHVAESAQSLASR